VRGYPGRTTIPLASNRGQVVYTHIAFPVSQLQETGVQNGEFAAPKWLW